MKQVRGKPRDPAIKRKTKRRNGLWMQVTEKFLLIQKQAYKIHEIARQA
jgi:hypothetical protein